ncbi:GGDEF domain-containing protein [Sulfuritalea sp.]|jgi:diguanylate cyclase (GGDEF)-like protein|uniref:GGDEF domain-containing protein n=1 Tax=Sulfuritalea sp. TaxID=2480090 RepID=UPI001AD3D142|nr:GGDEF domain-containing protein [Sulfuritalea sp.]MBN8475468.1 GGDEF domain-containing protein [Sulfuritalea sp.]
MSIDPRTVILLAGVMGGMMSLVLFFMRRNYPTAIAGLGEWAAAAGLIFVSTLLLGARGAISDLLSVVGGNTLLLAGLALFHIGSQRFIGLRPWKRIWAGLILSSLPVMLWYTLVEPHYGVRVFTMSLLMAVLTAAHAWTISRHGIRSLASYLCIGALVVQAIAQSVRLFSAFGTTPDSSLFILSPAQTYFVTTYALCLLVLSIGVVLMATDKLRTEFEHMARHDSLTGALTRRAFLDSCAQELERDRRKNRVSSLLIMDLDHFKAVNDSYGHQAGDRVLIDFVDRVGGLLRRPDQFGRFGGEEFVALLPETTLDEALVVAERIRAGVEQARAQPGCTVSIGVATSVPGEGAMDTILGRADEALYRAKAAGRNCVRAAA